MIANHHDMFEKTGRRASDPGPSEPYPKQQSRHSGVGLSQVHAPPAQVPLSHAMGYDDVNHYQPPPYHEAISKTVAPYQTSQSQQQAYPCSYATGYQTPVAPPPNVTYVVPHAFDAGARFDNISQPHIPPPPPGVVPNAAQMAAANGHTVVLSRKPDNFWKGGSDGGYTFW